MNGKYRALWLDEDDNLVVLDQRLLPFEEKTVTITTAQQSVEAIANMTVRGAGVIGNVAAFGVYLAARESDGDMVRIEELSKEIRESRPTAVNLMWAVDRMMGLAHKKSKLKPMNLIKALKNEAIKIADEDCERSQKIAEYGADIIEEIMLSRGLDSFNILTHCNAGWLAIVDSGTALAPIYEAQKRDIKIHVWVDETRPRNQGANLTAWELSKAGIEHTVIADNTGGHLMQQSMVDMVITGADRVARNGDSANKIGTYLKALAAKDNDIPFYIALPASTFDFEILDGVEGIPIEIRNEDEVKFISGLNSDGEVQEIQIVQSKSSALNYGFDVTPARLITGLITERGDCEATVEAIIEMFGDLI
ncbi:S-methyl-5-thioribose-1-phosphate isomerase [Sulfurovum sp. bin170]|uniref:S-methyl-5-thioribose-1-phosphate isomerase n=1 Tax=Sulfurovum sp. bin170 TaxID=2695268 RepID=UPI0013E0DC2F|nr:S-methyl-5-thioribose-1-phosphate isomerase [Sulfurovum sp. bin170]NEW60996.1 S-methyl-5-thioribose-1-phosphate isomerase [Sulfurovum sp. bin170]